MYQVYLVGFMACCVVLLAGLILAVAAPYLARAQYRGIRGHGPQAIWIARLELASLEGASLLVLAGGIGQVVTTFGNAPLLSTTGPQQWVWLVVLLYSLGGLALLAVTSLAALAIAQWHRYGLPPRNPPT